MKCLQLLSLSFILALFISCGSDIGEIDKINGDWVLESVSGGFTGGGFPVESSITMSITDDELQLFNDEELTMNAYVKYKYDDHNRLFIKLNKSYVSEMAEFSLGGSDQLFILKSEDGQEMSLSQPYADGYSFDFEAL